MQRQEILTADHYLIKVQAEANNNEIRDVWRGRYTRIAREKKSKLWRVWYNFVD